MTNSSHHQTISELIGTKLTIGDQLSFTVNSTSMQPIMKIGDKVVAEVIPETRITRGDIIVIKTEEDFLTHRAISPIKGGWITKGDNNTLSDAPVLSSTIIARVQKIQRTSLTINFETYKWHFINPLLAKLGKLETTASSYHHSLRLPIRTLSKAIQTLSCVHFRKSH